MGHTRIDATEVTQPPVHAQNPKVIHEHEPCQSVFLPVTTSKHANCSGVYATSAFLTWLLVANKPMGLSHHATREAMKGGAYRGAGGVCRTRGWASEFVGFPGRLRESGTTTDSQLKYPQNDLSKPLNAPSRCTFCLESNTMSQKVTRNTLIRTRSPAPAICAHAHANNGKGSLDA